MHLGKRVAAGAAALLLPAAVAAAATSPSGVFSGTVHSKDAAGHPDAFTMQTTFDKGKVTRLQGQGPWIPYDPSKSNSEACGAANTFDTSASGDTWTITGKTANGAFSYKLKDKYHTVITLKGQFTSKTQAKAKFRYYQSHLPYFNKATNKSSSTGHCDSGQMKVKLSAS